MPNRPEGKKNYNVLMVTDDSLVEAVYHHAVHPISTNFLASTLEQALELSEKNPPDIVFIDHAFSYPWTEKLVSHFRLHQSSAIIIFLSDTIINDMVYRLWGRAEELHPKPITASQLEFIYNRYFLSPDSRPVGPWRIASRIIAQRYSEPALSEQLVAKELGLTPSSYFSRMFKARTGKVFHLALQDTRIKEAKKLLLDPSLQIKEIGFRVGFNRFDSFVKSFHNTTGESPSQYRRRILLKTSY